MILEQLPLARQIDMVFRELREELSILRSGIVFIHIRNNIVGKFGIKHDPIDSKDGILKEGSGGDGLTDTHFQAFRQMGIQSLKHKKNWTHGEIMFEFALKQSTLIASVQFESNYNMSNLLLRLN